MGERQQSEGEDPALQRTRLMNQDEDTGIIAHGDLDDNEQVKNKIFDHLTQEGRANAPR